MHVKRQSPSSARRRAANTACPGDPASPKRSLSKTSRCVAAQPQTSMVRRRAASAHRKPAPYLTSDLPLAVWACAQTTSQWQRHGRYLPASNRHPGKMLPALARKAIETYSDPGDLVIDPMCGIGTTLVEAIHLGRRAIGVELEHRWATLATANLDHAHHQGADTPAQVIRGDARRLPRLLSTRGQNLLKPTRAKARPGKLAHIGCGHADLILTSPPYACQIADVSIENLRNGSGPLCREDTTNYGPDRSNLGYARGEAYLNAMAEIYAACAAALKPGGFLVLVTKNMRARGALRDLSGQTVALCQHTGLLYWQHIIGLLARVGEDGLAMRPSFWQTLQVRRARARSERTLVAAHEDILVFRKPPLAVSKKHARGRSNTESRIRAERPRREAA